MNCIKNMPFISITYFVPDERKKGGEYVTLDDQIKKIDTIKQQLITKKGKIVPVEEIVDMQGELFKNMEMEYLSPYFFV